MKTDLDLAVIGGGASGALAALGARRAGFAGNITVFEKEEEPFRKILASGNGRCNLANYSAAEGRYHGENPGFALDILSRFPARFITGLFEEMGLLTLEDKEGRLYPRSLQARSVALILEEALKEEGILLSYPSLVQEVVKNEGHFQIRLAGNQSVRSRALILAGGGMASPQLGGSGLPLDMLESLGHRTKTPVPALVPLLVPDHPLTRYAQGVRFRGRALLQAGNGQSRLSEGEFLIASYGLSGIAAMELGSLVSRSPGKLEIDFLPEREEAFIQKILAGKDSRPALSGLVPDKIGRALLILSDREGIPLHRLIKRLVLPVTGNRGFDFAQVAAGGVLTADFDPDTLMSKIQDGLFACGEVLDIDGDTGGFNLLWAFSSGYLAGRSAALYLMGDKS